MIFNWIEYSPVTYGDYKYPAWADGLGWFLASMSLVCIPIGAVLAVYRTPGSSLPKVGACSVVSLCRELSKKCEPGLDL